MIDTSPIILNQVSNKLLCKSPLQIEISVYDELYILQEDSISLDDVYLIDTREQLIEEVSGYICWLWQEYVEVDIKTLASDARELRQKLLNKFEVIV